MSFINLENRFNQTVKELYATATTKFENGQPSSGQGDDPLIVRNPGNGYFGRVDRAGGRSLPVNSTIQDVKRLTLFTLSPRGLLFLAKQALLQTGNTFDQTRIINPAFIIANAVPFLHIKRNLRPLSELFGKTDTSDDNIRKLGALQESTFKAMTEKFETKPGRFWVTLDKNLSRGGGPNFLKRLGAQFTSVISGFTAKRNIWDKEGYGDRTDNGPNTSWAKIRPELTKINPLVNKKNRKFQQNLLKSTNFQGGKLFAAYFDTPTGEDGGGIRSLADATAGKPDANGVISAPDSFGFGRWERLTKIEYGGTRTQARKISYIKDPANIKNKIPRTQANVLTPYKPIPHTFDDAIIVSFAIGNNEHIQFRAFIKDLTESASPQYNSYQYIGRVEKFINYTGVQREISFKLSVLAFGDDELNTVWRRINYITGMVFPYGFTRGILQPNIVRLTIGDVYHDQPGYISSLNTNFNEPAGSWEITKGRQVPIGATMDIKFVIIEKATKIAQSPFYGITEEMRDPASQRFNKLIPVPRSVGQTQPETDAPVIEPQVTEPL
jgi:hypothetical protein